MAEEIITTVSSNYDLVCFEGDNFAFGMDVKDDAGANFNFTGYSAKMHVRKRRVETDPLILSFSTTNGDIVLTSGHIAVNKAAAGMQAMSGEYQYDLKIIEPSGAVTTWLYGKFIIKPTVTV